MLKSYEYSTLFTSFIDENDDDDDGDGVGVESTSSGRPSNRKRRGEKLKKDATFMEGVPGVTLLTDQIKLNTIQQRIQDICDWKRYIKNYK